MASTSAANTTHTHMYDVFLSFRGIDTRCSFTDYLYKELLGAGLCIFRDDNAIDRGEEIKSEIETAIIKSRASIVVLSKNYANSKWCLNELCLILDQRRNYNHFVLPVFYLVEPTDVKHKLCSSIKGSNWTMDDVGRWNAALTEVASLAGMTLKGQTYETKFIKNVVKRVKLKLDLKLVSTPAHLTGIETRVEDISSWMENKQYNAIAICGMGGIGKTTLAQCIYNSNKHKFEKSSFVEKIGENYKHGLRRLLKQLLRDVSGDQKMKISSALEGTSKIEDVLPTKKMLIVLDDIDDQEQLSTLLGTKVFHAESKIIITTRLRHIDAWCASESLRCFEELAKQLAQYCGGNPLALKVLGSSLFVNDEDTHKRKVMIKIWRDRLNSLNSSKGDLDCKIQNVLRKSFDSLQFDSHKELFLDIACFFVGESEDMVTLWRDDLHVKYGVMTLINSCLLSISPTNKLAMHQLLQDMGRKIVCEESKDPSKRSRVWHYDESYTVLRKGDGSNTIECLALDMPKAKQWMGLEQLALTTNSLARMYKLKLLQLKNVTLTGSYEKFPELRWLCWHGCPLETMHPGLLQSSLVVIDMSYGHMETFEVPMVLHSLKILNLKECYKLVSICNFYHLPKLEELLLSNCSNLTHLCKSIGDLESLALLDLKWCTKLLNASSNKKNVKSSPERSRIDGANSENRLFSLPCWLKFLYLSNCNIEYNNEVQVAFHDTSCFNLYLENNPFKLLPNSIDLKMVKTLNLYSCPNLKSLSCIPSTLEELYVDRCKSLERITFQSGRFSLEQFSYEGCSKLSEVQGLFKLVPIANIHEADLVQHMQWIKEYEDNEVDLVGDEITRGRDWQIQMLYEYGIMSTYIQGIKDQDMTPYEYKSPIPNFSFLVPSDKTKQTIQGLHVSCLYRSSIFKNKERWLLFAKIKNISKGLTWVYNPMVYCNPRVDEDVMWLSYWPIGNKLDAGDEVSVSIIVDEGVIASKCSASLCILQPRHPTPCPLQYRFGEVVLPLSRSLPFRFLLPHHPFSSLLPPQIGMQIRQIPLLHPANPSPLHLSSVPFAHKYVNGEGDNCENTMHGEVIRGDMSEFKVTAEGVTTEGYYLCRRNFFGSETSSKLKELFGNDIDYPVSQGWRKTRRSKI
ncbi:putative TIR domain, P-loop containing nucleoside triphosphate hydrolase [Helianthus annuus]|nr:putative TIR domain, P-loop containing nucleoside triphosphate hydrolase [Helianthus annuus]